MDHGQNVKVSDVKLNLLQRIKISFGFCPCKLYMYVEQSLLFSLLLLSLLLLLLLLFNTFQCLHVNGCAYIYISDRDCYLQRETVADLLYVTCFCNVYAWILIKYQLHFEFPSDFYSATKALSTPLPRIMIIVSLEPTFPFFVLTSGRSLPVTTFFVFSKPLCSHFAAQIVIPEFSAPLQQRCSSLSKGFPLQPNLRPLQPALLQLFCSAS